MNTCCYCHLPGDLRPYGPKGALLCFPCMTTSPEREKEAEKNFADQLNACGAITVINGTEVGPYPYHKGNH